MDGYADSQNPPSPYSGKNSTAAPTAAPSQKQTELNIYCKFTPGPYKTDAEILKAVRPPAVDKWFPSTAELLKFASSGPGSVEPAANLWNFLCLIYRHKPARINLFTHGSENGQIGLCGKVVEGDVKFGKLVADKVIDSPEIWLSGGSLGEAESADFSDEKSKNITMDMVRSALPKEANLFIYACHSGLDPLELVEIKKKLTTKIHAFSKSIFFRPIPSADGKGIVDWEYSSDKAATWHKDFHGLTPDLPR